MKRQREVKDQTVLPRKKNDQELFIKFLQDQEVQEVQTLDQTKIAPWLTPKILKISNPLIRFHNEIIAFVKYIQPSAAQHQRRKRATDQIKEMICSKISNKISIHNFGSFQTKLYLPQADIDLAIEANQISDKTIFDKIVKILQESQDIQQLLPIRNAKVPIIKFMHKKSQIQFDLSVNKFDGVKHIKEVKKVLEVYPEFKYLTFVMKCFLRQRDLNQTYSGGVGSFLLFCMILGFLRYYFKRQKNQNSLLSEILIDFMKFYAGYKEDLSRYRINLTKRHDYKGGLSLLSPQDLSHDIGQAAFRMKQVISVLKNRVDVLMHTNFGEQSILRYLINPCDTAFLYQKNENII